MKKEKLTRSFYTGPTLRVSKELLGKYIVRKIAKKTLVGKIIETETYIGPQDRASHAYLSRHLRKRRGEGRRTKRNQAEYLVGGHIYIYLVYGMYWQLNISTSLAGKPECVLIRALEPIKNDVTNSVDRTNLSQVLKLANGPGKLCRWLKLDKSFYGEDLCKSERLWLEGRGEKIKPSQIMATKRIGIDYAGHYWSHRKWRFFLDD